jgi:DNA polymerase-1
MAHQNPNMANVPNEKDNQGRTRLYGGDFRGLWRAPKGKLLVGCDAEGIQLRGFAHYIDDKEFTNALVHGSKKDKSDPHSLNKRILGNVCKDRQAAKRFIYALLLGAGILKLAEVLEASEHETKSALERLMERYQGFTYLKKHIIPADAERGYFIGLDGRLVSIPGETVSYRAHLAMSGYLQNFEKVCMAKATTMWTEDLDRLGVHYLLVNLIHDEWQTECNNNMDEAILIGRTQCESLRKAGEYYHTKCPLAGSFWNEDKNDYTIGTNWKVTH